MKNLFRLAIACTLAFPAFSQTGLGVPQLQSCDNLVNNFLNQYSIPGATLAIAKNGKLIYMKGFGYHDIAQTDSVQPHHLFRIASVSKPITAIAIMKMVENAQLNLSDKVFGTNGLLANHTYLSTATVADNRINDITVQHLLEHTAGWDRNISCVNGAATPYSFNPGHCDPIGFPLHVTHSLGEPNPVNEEMHIKFLMEKGLEHAPGTNYHYSNIGYLVLGEIIEEVSGMSYQDYLETEIFSAIGVCDMHIGKSLLSEKMEREVEYTGNGGSQLSAFGTGQSVPWEYGGWVLEAMSAHGGWIATARDLVRLVLAVDGFNSKPDILNASTRNLMVTPSSVFANYAKGWSVNSFGNWWHTGSLDGAASIIVRDSGGYVWAFIMNKRSFSNNFWSDLDNLPWNCIAGFGATPTVDFLATPTTAPTNINHGGAANGGVNINWTNGDGDKRLVVVKPKNAADAFPVDGVNYVADDNFGQGVDLGNNNFVVHDGFQNFVDVTGLAAGSQYVVRIYEYNQNSSTGQNALYNLCGRAEIEITPAVFSLPEAGFVVNLSPNPVKDHLNIELSESRKGNLQLINSAGVIVLEESMQGQQHQLITSQLPPGFYLLSFRSENGSSTHKFIKR